METAFTKEASYEDLQSQLAAEERKRKVLEALQARAMQGRENQVVSGRVVPYSPFEGLSKIAQAMLAAKGIKDSTKRSGDIESQIGQARKSATENVINTIVGKEQTGGPLRNVGEYQEFSPAIEADPIKGSVIAATDPYLKDSGVDKIAMQILKNKYPSSPISQKGRYIKSGSGWFDTFRNQYLTDEEKNKLFPVSVDANAHAKKKDAVTRADLNAKIDLEPELKAKNKAAEKKAEYEQKLIEMKPQAEMAIENAYDSRDNTSKYINKAIGSAKYWSTGLISQAAGSIGNTDSRKLRGYLDTIRASIGLEALQALKSAGGTLGSVTEAEHKLLRDKWTSLDQATSPEELKERLIDLQNQIDRSWDRVRLAYKKTYGKDYEVAKTQARGNKKITEMTQEEFDKSIGLQ